MEIIFRKGAPTLKDGLCIPVFVEKKLSPDLQVDKQVQEQLHSILKKHSFTGKVGELLEVVGTSPQIILFGMGSKKELEASTVSHTGAKLLQKLEALHMQNASIAWSDDISTNKDTSAQLALEFVMGLQMRAYRFDHYKTKQQEKDKPSLKQVILYSSHATELAKDYIEAEAILEGIFLNRDLLNEPPNILNPQSFAERVKLLTKQGLKVKILDEKELKKIGMEALLAVGSGSKTPSCVAIMEWKNGPADQKPLAFVGKGVTFDTGGLSLKPRDIMAEMKFDMGGAALVTGLMHSLARRKAKVNALGVIGLVENVVDSESYRPADILKSLSGQTIEVLDTDAEGRLVLADILTYTQDTFDPALMVDVATLTGAMLVCLGHEFAGLYTTDDKLAKQLYEAGLKVDEKVWRLPLHKNYHKLMESKIADMKNIGPPMNAGSTQAAEFLHRFIKKTPWAHIDIAGVAMLVGDHPLSGHNPPGYGVRLFNTFIKDNYEKH